MSRVVAQVDRSTEYTRKYLRRRRISILGVRADNIDSRTALDILRTFALCGAGGTPARVFFTNVHTVHVARRDPELRSSINSAELVLPDGSGLKIAGKLFGTPIVENLNGTDLIPRFLGLAESEGLRVFLLGSRATIVENCARRMRLIYPRINIVGLHHGHFSAGEEKEIIEVINSSRPHILLVGMGTPAQERWILRNATRLAVGVCIGVGGLFDFLSGEKARAPLWMRRLGIEWLYRFVRDPRSKWQRVFIEIPEFLLRIAVRRLTSKGLQPSFTEKGLVQ